MLEELPTLTWKAKQSSLGEKNLNRVLKTKSGLAGKRENKKEIQVKESAWETPVSKTGHGLVELKPFKRKMKRNMNLDM